MRKNDDCIAVYSRKSKFTGKGESIGNQVELCREYIRIHDGAADADSVIVYEDEGFSGGNLNRPSFKRMMTAAREHKFKAIVVYRLDRISRNVGDFSGLIEELSKLGIDFISIREQFDTGTPMGRAMMYIASVFSQLERETIAERIRDNMHELAKTGRWLGGTTPTGYTSESVKSVTIDGKAKKSCKLKLLSQEADVIRQIFDLYLECDSLTGTEAELMHRHIKTKNGNDYTRFSIKGILQNPVYVIADQNIYDYFTRMNAELFSGREEFNGVHGVLAYNRTDQEKGRATQFRPVDEWIVSVGQHPGIVSGTEWIQVQESLERNKSKSYRKPRSNEALLTGLLFCGCGSRMYPKLSGRKTADGSPVYTYVCKLKERSQRSLCNGRNVNGNALDAAVVEQVKTLGERYADFAAQLERSRKFYTGKCVENENRLAALRRDKAVADKKLEALVDSLAALESSGAKALVTRRIEALNQECREIETRMGELEDPTGRQSLDESEWNAICCRLSVFQDSIDDIGVAQKRAVVRAVVRRVIWDGLNAHVVLFGTADEEIGCLKIPENANCEGGTRGILPGEGTADASVKVRWGEDSK